jgi:hypothetical protein
MLGRVVIAGKAEESLVLLNVASLSSGIYTVIVKEGAITVREKLVISEK